MPAKAYSTTERSSFSSFDYLFQGLWQLILNNRPAWEDPKL